MSNRLALPVALFLACLLAPAAVLAQTAIRLAKTDRARSRAPLRLTERDGTMRAQTGVRLSMAAIPSPVGDQVVKMGSRVQAVMAAVRRCYGQAVLERPSIHGEVELRVEVGPRGATKVWVARTERRHKPLARCFAEALRRADMRGIPTRAAAKVKIAFSQSGVAGEETVAARAARASRVRIQQRRDGGVSSEGGTQGGEVRFELHARRDSRSARSALASLHEDVADRLAGLLDCRRRASRRGMRARGALVFDVQTGAGRLDRVRTLSSQLQDPKAPQCVKTWLSRALPERLKPGRVQLTLRFD